MTFFRPIAAIIWKDIVLELRTRDTILSVAVFSVVVLVIFNFAFDINSFTATTLAPGILWVAFTFAGILAVNRSIVLEHENNSFEGLLLTPVVKDKIFFGKMVSIFLFMIVVELILVPIFGRSAGHTTATDDVPVI